MLMLLPPSEGKTAPEAGPTFTPRALSRPHLNPARARVLTALVQMCKANPERAIAALDLGPTQAGLVAANTRLAKAPAAPAIEVYTGVLYEALDFASLPAAARRRANSRLAIASALFGLLEPSDPIPAYRLSGDTRLPGFGSLAEVWRAPLEAEFAGTPGVVLDMRSGAYTHLAPLPSSLRDRAATVRVLLERGGRRSVVSHHNKSTKGLIARAVLGSTRVPRTLDGVEDYLAGLGFACELDDTKAGPRLDVIVRAT